MDEMGQMGVPCFVFFFFVVFVICSRVASVARKQVALRDDIRNEVHYAPAKLTADTFVATLAIVLLLLSLNAEISGGRRGG